jgi:ribosomal-protein-alanine N-acetyltransferase
LKSKGAGGFVARDKNKKGHPVLGFVIYRIAASEAEIITIATEKKHRGSGIARAMIDEMIRHCLSSRLTEIFLEVDESNIGAVRLYRKLGFIKVGERRGYYTGISEAHKNASNEGSNEASSGNALIMRLDLAS